MYVATGQHNIGRGLLESGRDATAVAAAADDVWALMSRGEDRTVDAIDDGDFWVVDTSSASERRGGIDVMMTERAGRMAGRRVYKHLAPGNSSSSFTSFTPIAPIYTFSTMETVKNLAQKVTGDAPTSATNAADVSCSHHSFTSRLYVSFR